MCFLAIGKRIFRLIISPCLFSRYSALKLSGSHRRRRLSLYYLTLSQRDNEQKQKFASADAMNETTTVGAVGAHILPSPSAANTNHRHHYRIDIQFTEYQLKSSPDTSESLQIKHLINEKIKNKELFYGLEMMARTHEPNVSLDYNTLGPLLPLFTSIVWLGMDYWDIPNIEDIEAIHLARKLDSHVQVMPHLSCYRLTEERLREFLNLNFSNILSVRGDFYDLDQAYKHSSELVEAIRSIRGDSVSIGIAGYPEGHPECKSMDEDMGNMVKKVSAGADFIITQICFSSRPIIDFIKHCRANAIEIPILVGIFVPDNFRMLEAMLRITKIKMSSDELQEYRRHYQLGDTQFTDFAVDKAVQMINAILHSDEVEVYGLQFFSMNKFQNIPKVLEKITTNTNKAAV